MRRYEPHCCIPCCPRLLPRRELNGGAISSASCLGPAVLNGTTFQHNLAGGSGGALSAQQCAMAVDNSTFTNNTAASFHGGALFLTTNVPGDDIVLTNSHFTSNAAGARGDGGGAYVSAPTIILGELQCRNNSAAQGSGGAVAVFNSESALLYGGSYTNNSATTGGGAYITRNTVAQVLGAAFERNVASTSGGGMRVDGCRLLVANGTRFTDNMATRGGAVSLQPAVPRGPSSSYPTAVNNGTGALLLSTFFGMSEPGQRLLRGLVAESGMQPVLTRRAALTGSVGRSGGTVTKRGRQGLVGLASRRRLQQGKQWPESYADDPAALVGLAMASGVGVLGVRWELYGNEAAVAGGGLHVDGGAGDVVLDGLKVRGRAMGCGMGCGGGGGGVGGQHHEEIPQPPRVLACCSVACTGVHDITASTRFTALAGRGQPCDQRAAQPSGQRWWRRCGVADAAGRDGAGRRAGWLGSGHKAYCSICASVDPTSNEQHYQG